MHRGIWRCCVRIKDGVVKFWDFGGAVFLVWLSFGTNLPQGIPVVSTIVGFFFGGCGVRNEMGWSD